MKTLKKERELVEGFMGYSDGYLLENITWNDVMMIVEKIRDVSEEIGDEEGELYIKMQREEFLIFDLPLCTPIEEVWESAIEFITWYNQNKQP